MITSIATSIATSKADIAASTPALASSSLQMAAAAILGMVVLMGVGFAPMDVVHNAAHDARHSFAFPCH